MSLYSLVYVWCFCLELDVEDRVLEIINDFVLFLKDFFIKCYILENNS